MRLGPGRLAVISLVGLVGAGCASRDPAPPSSNSATYEEVVEVNNRASFPVVVRYYTQGGGGPHPLGTVGALQREVFMLPADRISIRIETEGGQRIERRAGLIGIRRYRVDPLTGERVSRVRVIRHE